MRHSAILVIASLMTVACSKAPELHGKVTDVFGKPLMGATVVVEPSPERTMTNALGDFVMKVKRPSKIQLLAGLDGYLKDTLMLDILADKKKPLPTPTFALWPEPDGPGFFGKGSSALVHLKTAKVQAVGSETREVHGVRDLPHNDLPPARAGAQFLFKSTLRAAEITQMDLRLVSLAYTDQTEVKGVEGPTQVNFEMWTLDKPFKFELKAMVVPNIYLIVTEALPAGEYAFESQNILAGTDPGSLAHLPAEMQVIYPFTITK